MRVRKLMVLLVTLTHNLWNLMRQQNCGFYALLTARLSIILFNDQLDTQFFFVYVYFSSVHVSSIQVLIIRRFSCINTISGMCHSMQVTVWYAGLDRTSKPAYQMVRVIYTRYRIDTIASPDDEHVNDRNMQGLEINVYKKELCVKLVTKQKIENVFPAKRPKVTQRSVVVLEVDRKCLYSTLSVLSVVLQKDVNKFECV